MEHKLPSSVIDNKTNTPTNNHTLFLTQQELDSLIVEYSSRTNSNSSHSLPISLANKYSQIQWQIRQVVEMRKDMQKIIEIDVLQSQHSHTIQQLIRQNIDCHKNIEQLSNIIKQYQSSRVEDTLNWLKSRLQSVQYSPNVCLTNEIILLANQIAKSFHYSRHQQLRTLQPDQIQAESDSFNFTSQNQNELNSIINQQKQKYQVIKSIYACRFKELSIRDELISQRQEAFYDYSASNHQLIDALLREKERQRNLSRNQRQKFEQLLKARHQIQLQNEHMSYHQNNLVAYYQIELTQQKGQIIQREEVWNAQRQLLMSNQTNKILQIQKLSAIIKKITEQKETLKTQLQSKNKLLQQNSEKIHQLRKQFQQKMESLQSQLNQNILKLSQTSRNKSELTQKLEEANKKIAEVQLLKNRVRNLQAQNEKQQLIRQQLLRKNQQLDSRGETSQSEIFNLQQKIQYLQNQLTQSFIINNAEIKRLNNQIVQKNYLIQNLQNQRYNHLRQIQHKHLIEQTNKNELRRDSEQHQKLRRQLQDQLQRQSELKQKLLDEAIERISNLLY